MKKKFRLSSFIFVTTLLLIFAGSLFLFWKDLNRATVRSDIQKIGKIEYKYKIAQRKFVDRVAWERVQQNSDLYNGDSIRTAEGAMAQLILADTVIEIQEETTIQVFYSEEKGLNLSVDNGNISVDTTAATSSVSLNLSNGQNIKMDPGSKIMASIPQFAAQEERSNPVSITVQSGMADISTATGDVVQINSGESVRLSDEGTVQKVPVSITSVSDNIHILSFDNNDKSVLLNWIKSEAQNSSETTNAGSKAVVVETSRNKNFTTIDTSSVVKDASSLNITASEGKTYWRVYLEDEPENYVTGKIQVDNVSPIEPLSPMAGYLFESPTGSSNVTFSWKGNEYVSYYQLEVALTPDFANPVYTQQTSSNYALCKNLAAGNYYWRVTPFYAVNQIGFGQGTEASLFTIEKNTVQKAPELNLPAEKAKFILKNGSGAETSSDSSNLELLFVWKSYTEDSNYKVIVASDVKFNNVIYSADSSNGKLNHVFDANDLQPGTYYWKVVSATQKDDNGKLLESKTRSFVTEKYVPGENKLIYPPDNYKIQQSNTKKLEFMWKLATEFSDPSTESEIQVASDSAFTNVIVSKKIKNSYVSDINLASGKYWWRVGVKSADTEIKYTRPNILLVLEELKAPVITAPVSASTVAIQKENTVTARWNSVSGATSYIVKIFDSEKTYGKLTVNNTDAVLSLPESIFDSSNLKQLNLSVQAVAAETESSDLRMGPEAEISFTVRKPQRVVLVSPNNLEKINGLTARQSPVVFKWKSGEDVESVQFILKKMQPNGEMRVIKTVTTKDSTVSVPELYAGNYEWTVKAASKDGINLDALSAFNFTVNPIPQLAGARLVSPSVDQVIGPRYLTTNKSIYFKWNAVTGATEYQFILYQKLPNGKLKRIYSVHTKKTELTYKDLATLDIGSFEWQIIAYSYGSDGREEQRSRAAIGRFSIDFDIPEEVETIEPGRMYGE